MKTLEELLIDENFLKLKKKIKQKFSFLDCDDIESAYHVSMWQTYEKFNEDRNVKFTTLFYKMFYVECLNLCKSFIQSNKLSIDIVDENLNSFQTLLGDLSENDRKLLLQRYLEQKTLEEISSELEVSISTVSRRIKECLGKLKEE